MALRVKTAIDGSGFAAGLQKMEADAANFGKNLSGKIGGNISQAVMGIIPGLTGALAGVFAADSIKASLSEFAKRGEEIEFGSARMNVSPETYQRVDRVMKEIGSDANAAAAAFDKLAQAETAIEQGRDNTGQLAGAFAELGVSADQLASKDYQKIFFQIADGMKDITPSKEQVSALRQVFGRQGDALMPAFKLGFDSAFAKGGIINDRDLAAIKAYNEQWRDLRTRTSGFWNWLKGISLASATAAMTNPSTLSSGFHRNAQGFITNEAADTHNAAETQRLAGLAAAQRRADVLQEAHHKEMERLDKEDRAKAAAINKETALLRERNKVAAMTPEKQRLELLQQIKSMEGELKFGGGDLSRADEAATRKRIEELRGQIAEMDRAALKPHHAAFANVGNQAIGGIMLGHDRMGEMNTHMRQTAQNTARIAQHLASPRPGRSPTQDYH